MSIATQCDICKTTVLKQHTAGWAQLSARVVDTVTQNGIGLREGPEIDLCKMCLGKLLTAIK